MKFVSNLKVVYNFLVGNSLYKNISKVKHRIFIVESTCSIFLPYGLPLQDFFSAAFVQDFFFWKLPNPSLKKIIVLLLLVFVSVIID